MSDDTEIFKGLTLSLEKGEAVVLCTVVKTRGSTPRKAGAKMVVRPDGRSEGTICGGCVEAEVYAAAMELFEAGERNLLSFTLNDEEAAEFGLRCGGSMDVYLEKVMPRRQLYLIGAGHIGQALAVLSRSVDFEVHVLDEHSGFLTEEKFPGCITHECDLTDVSSVIPEGAHIAVSIATRGHKQDSAALHALVDHQLGYLGLVTSRKRVMEFYRPLLARGISEERLRQIAAPIGLDIGAESPEEIAIAVMAEILARFRSGTGTPLSALFWESGPGKKLPKLAEAAEKIDKAGNIEKIGV